MASDGIAHLSSSLEGYIYPKRHQSTHYSKTPYLFMALGRGGTSILSISSSDAECPPTAAAVVFLSFFSSRTRDLALYRLDSPHGWESSRPPWLPPNLRA